MTTLSDKGEIIGVTVDGTFVRGKIHGSATLLYPDGAKYSGKILRGTPNGTGEMSWSDGSSFKGKWNRGSVLFSVLLTVNLLNLGFFFFFLMLNWQRGIILTLLYLLLLI